LPEQIVAGVDWQQFKAVQAAFDGIPEIGCTVKPISLPSLAFEESGEIISYKLKTILKLA
jgi:hypothetical protein